VNPPAIRVRNLQRAANLAASGARAMACRIVRNDAGPTRVDVYDDIGAGWFGGIGAQDFVNQLAEINGDIEVHINSGGGDVFDGIAIYNAIAGRSSTVTTVVDGIAASIASIIAQAGQSRVIAPGAMMMIHDALSMCIGNAADMRETAELLDQVSDNLASVYASRGGTSAQWRDAMKTETWYTAQEAVDAGLADKLAERPANPADVAAHDFTVFARVPRWLADAAQPHGPMSGTHSHPHPAYGGQGGNHEHEHTHDGDAHHGHEHPAPEGDGQAANQAPRVLGVESMPLNGPLPVHHTATVDKPWDGPAAVKAMPNDDAVLRYCHAWQSDQAESTPHKEGDEDADDKKSAYKFPHHTEKGGPANVNACSNGLARLEGSTIPDGDKAGVRAHLQAHLDDAHKNDAEDHHEHPIDAAAYAASFRQAFKEA